jgi:hypothetical protein
MPLLGVIGLEYDIEKEEEEFASQLNREGIGSE